MSSPVPEALARRKSAAFARQDAYHKQLLELFKEIGVPEGDWDGRMANIWEHVMAAMQEDVEEEKRRVRMLTHNIDETGRRLLQLASQLGQPVEEPDENLSLLELDRVLTARLQQLREHRDRILADMKQLRDEESELCTQLDMPPLSLSSEIPQESDFREVRAHLTMLREERQRRAAAFQALRQRLFPLLESLERSAEGELQTQVVWAADGEFRLSEANLAALEADLQRLEADEARNRAEADSLRSRLGQLWTRLEVPEDRRASVLSSCADHKPSTLRLLREEAARCDELKHQNLEKFVRTLRTEIAELWERCYYSESQRAAFTAFTANVFTESLLEQHEEELDRVRRYYDMNRVLIKDVDEHQKLWQKMLELEERANDPARYSNRGGQLLMEEKERKKIARRLPKVESDLQQLIQRWENQHNTTFLVHGHDFAAYIRQQKLDHAERKEREREERATKKATQLEHETLFGARPVTPAKRRPAVAERASPSKQRRLESTRLGSRLRAPSPGLGRTARTPLTLFNPAATNRNSSMARTAPGKLTARDVSLASDMSYAEFTRGLQRLQAAGGGGGGSPALRAATRSRRRSQRLRGLPPAAGGGRTPRAARLAAPSPGAGRSTRAVRLAAPSPAAGRSPRSAARNRSRLGLPVLI